MGGGGLSSIALRQKTIPRGCIRGPGQNPFFLDNADVSTPFSSCSTCTGPAFLPQPGG